MPKRSPLLAKQSQILLDTEDRRFKYPINFEPIPYSGDTKYETFVRDIIPRATTSRLLSIVVPKTEHTKEGKINQDDMDIDRTLVDDIPLDFATTEVNIRSDGILLYVAQASYVPGNSPLSNWIPLMPLSDGTDANTNVQSTMTRGSPLALFER